MDLMPYVARLQRDLAVAAAAGGEDARALAERLAAPLEAATRLVLLDALSAAAGEITSELAPGSVDLRLRGGDPEFVVTPPARLDDTATAQSDVNLAPVTEPDEGGTARFSLRLPEQLKPRVEAAAAQAGLSVNAWLVRVVAGAVERGEAAGRGERSRSSLGQSFRGWVS
jgi:HicB-like protein involved in pilus formation